MRYLLLLCCLFSFALSAQTLSVKTKQDTSGTQYRVVTRTVEKAGESRIIRITPSAWMDEGQFSKFITRAQKRGLTWGGIDLPGKDDVTEARRKLREVEARYAEARDSLAMIAAEAGLQLGTLTPGVYELTTTKGETYRVIATATTVDLPDDKPGPSPVLFFGNGEFSFTIDDVGRFTFIPTEKGWKDGKATFKLTR